MSAHYRPGNEVSLSFKVTDAADGPRAYTECLTHEEIAERFTENARTIEDLREQLEGKQIVIDQLREELTEELKEGGSL